MVGTDIPVRVAGAILREPLLPAEGEFEHLQDVGGRVLETALAFTLSLFCDEAVETSACSAGTSQAAVIPPAGLPGCGDRVHGGATGSGNAATLLDRSSPRPGFIRRGPAGSATGQGGGKQKVQPALNSPQGGSSARGAATDDPKGLSFWFCSASRKFVLQQIFLPTKVGLMLVKEVGIFPAHWGW